MTRRVARTPLAAALGEGPATREGVTVGKARGAPSQANVECGDGARMAAAARPWLARARVGKEGQAAGEGIACVAQGHGVPSQAMEQGADGARMAAAALPGPRARW
jgi:hypothetical protein